MRPCPRLHSHTLPSPSPSRMKRQGRVPPGHWGDAVRPRLVAGNALVPVRVPAPQRVGLARAGRLRRRRRLPPAGHHHRGRGAPRQDPLQGSRLARVHGEPVLALDRHDPRRGPAPAHPLQPLPGILPALPVPAHRGRRRRQARQVGGEPPPRACVSGAERPSPSPVPHGILFLPARLRPLALLQGRSTPKERTAGTWTAHWRTPPPVRAPQRPQEVARGVPCRALPSTGRGGRWTVPPHHEGRDCPRCGLRRPGARRAGCYLRRLRGVQRRPHGRRRPFTPGPHPAAPAPAGAESIVTPPAAPPIGCTPERVRAGPSAAVSPTVVLTGRGELGHVPVRRSQVP